MNALQKVLEHYEMIHGKGNEVYTAAVAEVDALEAAIVLAQKKLRSTSLNWQEQCLFDCDAILSSALKGGA